ncbi:four-carbon acid sugar kinase family protein [Paenibacillus arenilitoris]|uniref:Four-carbon acid sugar kinase family protein n=1 Tax=Paenibacillus arenilitoris TaxID=2772299 RepID=A0A927CKN0_9BACL|nr:four-carbon acid sugar kinase family protein [Paenibacillus arenilitoris]MBD2868507.1 four-carbon acid sugar kinase family protein [Paenibacillus arenilitoris]
MKLAIIADDLTGASDSGAQLAGTGMPTTVLINPAYRGPVEGHHLVVDTDSRAVSPEEAALRVREMAFMMKQKGYTAIYKKIDSTMRGNPGAEIEAVDAVFRPDFVIIAPGYPRNGRQVVDGRLYVDGVPLQETEFARDPGTPVHDGYIPNLLRGQTSGPIGMVTRNEIRDPDFRLGEKLDALRAGNIRYVLFDAETEEDLKWTVNEVIRTGYSVVWAGSAGLASHLPLAREEVPLRSGNRSVAREDAVLVVVGSVSGRSRRQLDLLLEQGDVFPVELRSERLADRPESRRGELLRALSEASKAKGRFRNLVLYSSGSPSDVKQALEAGRRRGIRASGVSDAIADALGEAALHLHGLFRFKGMVLTGGDTARRVCTRLRANTMSLFGEVEEGVPIGLLDGDREVIAITKAGGFGSDAVLLNAISKLRGEGPTCCP